MQKLHFLTLAVFFLTSCYIEKKEKSRLESNLEGTHQLRKMLQSSQTAGKFAGSFFLFSDSAYGEQRSEPIVSFAWQMKDSSYALSTLPFGKIRVKIADTVTVPSVKFRWVNKYEINPDNMHDVMNYAIIYAEISARAADWPQNISLPMNTDSAVVKK